ncbi:TetR/AcrR family transcriptional regulator [Roseibium sp.]|uniref:TetR/AcrR family transcriptional regulator n=1 Tax=Roseibium sp. TaxID=1936156 RepID=UPI003BAAC4CC
MSQETKSNRGRPGVSREAWLRAALDVFENEGIEAIRIESLAKRIGISKSGFYWHFENRDDLLRAMLIFWEEIENRPITALVGEQTVQAGEMLTAIADFVDQEALAPLDAAIRQWGRKSEEVANAYAAKLNRRLHVIRALFSELGFEGKELEMRVRTFVCYVSCEREIFADSTVEERKELSRLRVKLLTEKR